MEEIDVIHLASAGNEYFNEITGSAKLPRKIPLITQKMFERGAAAMLANQNASVVEQLSAALLAMGFKETRY